MIFHLTKIINCFNVIYILTSGDDYMKNLSDIHVIKNILSNHGFKFSKSLGQNFLINKDVCPRMAKACLQSDDCAVLEVGPGIGVLTLELAKIAKKVVSIELDKKLFPILNETLEGVNNVKLINADIMKLNLEEVIREEFGEEMNVCVCANLPYYITSPVIMKFLESDINLDNITVMVQKEAANRICARPKTRDVGAISFAVRYYSTPQILFDVPRSDFIPSPNVDSCVMKLFINKKPNLLVKDKKTFFKIVKSTFAQRRKVILNSIARGLSISKDNVAKLLESANVSIKARPEELSFEDFAKISNLFSER